MKKKALRNTEVLNSEALEAVLGQAESTITTGTTLPEEHCPACCSGVHTVSLDSKNTGLIGG